MSIPNLKRIKISTKQELVNYLSKAPDEDFEVMVVTVAKSTSAKHVTRAEIAAVLEGHKWIAGKGYTLIGGLNGQVITRA